MFSAMPGARPTRCLLALVAFLTAACTARAPIDRRVHTDHNLLTQEQLTEHHFATAYEAVASLRSHWLETRGTDSFTAPSQVLVYLDDTVWEVWRRCARSGWQTCCTSASSTASPRQDGGDWITARASSRWRRARKRPCDADHPPSTGWSSGSHFCTAFTTPSLCWRMRSTASVASRRSRASRMPRCSAWSRLREATMARMRRCSAVNSSRSTSSVCNITVLRDAMET